VENTQSRIDNKVPIIPRRQQHRWQSVKVKEAAAIAIGLPIEERTRDGKELRWKADRHLKRGGRISIDVKDVLTVRWGIV